MIPKEVHEGIKNDVKNTVGIQTEVPDESFLVLAHIFDILKVDIRLVEFNDQLGVTLIFFSEEVVFLLLEHELSYRFRSFCVVSLLVKDL